MMSRMKFDADAEVSGISVCVSAILVMVWGQVCAKLIKRTWEMEVLDCFEDRGGEGMSGGRVLGVRKWKARIHDLTIPRIQGSAVTLRLRSERRVRGAK